jgi:type II secretory pathway pseudopilin PulG
MKAMSTDEPFTPPRKKLSILWWLGGIFVLLVMLFVLQLFGPNPPILVSPQTTYITEPLGPDGLPDYEQYVLELYRDGVTPENNAAVLLWQALFPAEVDPQHFAVVATELGLEQLPLPEDALVLLHSKENRARVSAWARQQANSTATDASASGDALEVDDADVAASEGGYKGVEYDADAVIDPAMRHPWTSQQIPPLAQWVTENQQQLDLIVEASKRPRYYAPSPTLINNKQNLLIEMLLPQVQAIREAGRALPARAMWHLGEGRPDAAWQDLLALHRLSRLLAQGHTLVEQLVAIALSGMACEGTVTLLDVGHLTADEARQIERDLAALPPFSNVVRSLDEMERASALDAFIGVGTGGGGEMFSALSGVQDNDFGNQVFNVISVDWNLVLVETNRWYDRLVAAAELPNRPERAVAFAKIEADMQQLVARTRVPGRWLAGVVSRQQRSNLVSSIMLGLFLPAVTAATNAEDRANTELQLTQLASALARYRAEHGAYPTKLNDLVPDTLEKLPTELYNGKQFVYKRLDEGYVLYSPGENGTDDGGSHEQWKVLEGRRLEDRDDTEAQNLQSTIPAGADDISIRVPRPPLKPPKLIQPPP